MARSSKDIAKRLRFDHRPPPDAFRRLYAGLCVAACLGALGIWLVFGWTGGERQYLPGPVSPAHATFGERCAHCHVAFSSTPDAQCLACHAPRVHSNFEAETPACRSCHLEHRGAAALMTGGNETCVACHGALQSTRTPPVATDIVDFRSHPEFAPLRTAQRDPAALRFNHELHLNPERVRDDGRQPAGPLECADCHVADATGNYMLPIVFEAHCQRCHELFVTGAEIPAPISQIAAPHEAPPTVRADLTLALLALGAERANEIFVGAAGALLPGRIGRGPIEKSKSLLDFQRAWLPKLERALYAPFDDTPPLLEHNRYCFLCHIQGEGTDDTGLPRVVDPAMAERWLPRAVFSHRRHDEIGCAVCHAGIETSALTGEVNLPGRSVCAQCHADDTQQSAGADCTLCHRYHNANKRAEVAPRPTVTLDTLLGRTE